MRVIVVGGGNVGKNLTDILLKEKNKVVLLEKDNDLARALALNTDALVIKGDATDMSTLEDADIGSMDAIVADVSAVTPVPQAGEWAEIIGQYQTVEDVALQAGTLGYEILTSLGNRYTRIYSGHGS